jgi:hypothetical protein
MFIANLGHISEESIEAIKSTIKVSHNFQKDLDKNVLLVSFSPAIYKELYNGLYNLAIDVKYPSDLHTGKITCWNTKDDGTSLEFHPEFQLLHEILYLNESVANMTQIINEQGKLVIQMSRDVSGMTKEVKTLKEFIVNNTHQRSVMVDLVDQINARFKRMGVEPIDFQYEYREQ